MYISRRLGGYAIATGPRPSYEGWKRRISSASKRWVEGPRPSYEGWKLKRPLVQALFVSARDLPMRDGNFLLRLRHIRRPSARDLPMRDGNTRNFIAFQFLTTARDLPMRDGNYLR